MRRLLPVLVLGLIASSCHDPDRYFVGPNNIDSILSLTPTATTLPADGVSRTRITATLDSRTAQENREVTFTATTGTLIAGDKTGLELKVTADGSGVAIVELQSTTTVVVARVTATAGTTTKVVRTLDVSFAAVDPDTAFILTATPTSIPADGFSRALIRAQLKTVAGSTSRTVSFTAATTGLLFAPGESAGALTKTAAADSDGFAVVELQSSQNLETARVQATAFGVTRSVDVTFAAANARDILSLSSSASSAPADGATITRIIATVAPGLPAARRKVRFTSSTGSFVDQTDPNNAVVEQVADSSNRAVAELRSATVTGVAQVTATLVSENTSDRVSVAMVAAAPDRVVVTADDPSVENDGSDTVVIRVTLLRDIGTPTKNTVVTYTAVDEDGDTVGSFSNVQLSDAEGKSSAVFRPGTATAEGTVTIRVRVSSGSATGSTTVEVN